jgi:hypothetical protein
MTAREADLTAREILLKPELLPRWIKERRLGRCGRAGALCEA